VGVEGKKAAQLDSYLFDSYRIHCVPITWEKVDGVRITPNVYTTTKDLDKLIAGITEFAAKA
jgi:selenocysteine lyase/cysteine desulfurase